jgi:hypothetical protein
MRQVQPYPLWLGHVGDVRDLSGMLAAGVSALVDLAVDEPPARVTRELIYCRFPLVDGTGNAPPLLRLAIDTTAGLIRAALPTLVICSSGLSRTLAVAAAGLAAATGRPAAECLTELARVRPGDVSPGLWQDVRRLSATS